MKGNGRRRCSPPGLRRRTWAVWSGAPATQLADAGVGIADLSLSQPSLDEAFLALTGDRAGQGTIAHEDRNT